MKAVLTIGPSAVGKTSWSGMQDGFETIARDDIRFGILFPGIRGWKDYKFTNKNESEVTRIQKALIEDAALFKQDIIIGDTNLNTKVRKGIVRSLQRLGYDVEYLVFHVDVEQAIERDSYRRHRTVGENIIRQQYDKFNGILPSLKGEARNLGVEFSEIYN